VDFSMFDAILALHDEMTENLRDIMSTPLPAAPSGKARGARRVVPKATGDILERASKLHEAVFAALAASKPNPEARMQEILRAAAAPISALDATGRPQGPKVAKTRRAKPKRSSHD